MDKWQYWHRRYWDARREAEEKTWWMIAEAAVICFCVTVIIGLIWM